MQLGVYLMIIIILLRLIDFKSEDKQEKIVEKVSPIIMFGRASLTIFVFEAFVATIFHVFLDFINPKWNTEAYTVLIFGLFNLAFWWVILYFWRKKDFKGSVEWTGVYIIRKLSGIGSREPENI
jgi:amino acid transporter